MSSTRPTAAVHRSRRARSAGVLIGAAVAAIVTGGCGANTSSEPAREYVVDLHIDDSGEEYEYVADEAFDVKVGDRVTFRIENTGLLPHDVQVVDPNGTRVAAGPIADPGEVTEAVVMFEEEGIYQLNCLVDDHLTAHRMQALVQAEPATS